MRRFARPDNGSGVPCAAHGDGVRPPRRLGRRDAFGGRHSMLARFGSFVLVVALACVVVACGGLAVSTGAAAGSTDAARGPSLRLTDAWVRPAAAGGVSAAYLTISNPASSDDVLVGVSAPDVASRASVHETTTGDDGMTGMHHAPAIAIPANGSLALQPGGVHVMLEDLRTELVAGDIVRLQLAFEEAGVVEVDVLVRAE